MSAYYPTVSLEGGPIVKRGKTQFSSASEVTAALKKNAIVGYYNNAQSSQKSVPGSLYTSFLGGTKNVYGSPLNISGYRSPIGTIFNYSTTSVPASSNFASWNYVTVSMTPASGTLTTSGTFTSTQSGNGLYAAQVYSSTGYVSNVYCSTQYKTPGGSGYGYFGLSRNPSAGGVDGASINYGFYFNGAADVHMFELTINPVGTFTSAWTSNDVFKITYDGSNVNYFCNATNLRTVAAAPGTPLYVDAIPYVNGAQFVNLTLGTFASASSLIVTTSYSYTYGFVQSGGVLGEKKTPNMNVASDAVVNNPQ
jgi:hypothetical protein